MEENISLKHKISGRSKCSNDEEKEAPNISHYEKVDNQSITNKYNKLMFSNNSKLSLNANDNDNTASVAIEVDNHENDDQELNLKRAADLTQRPLPNNKKAKTL